MRKLPEVQEAKELMTEAMDWSTFKWMYEKPRVRKTADRANAALDRLNRREKARWSDEVKATYKSLSAKTARASQRQENDPQQPESGDSQLRFLVEKVKEADVAAHHARLDAEKAFDEAERRLSTTMAREGCRKAIHSWELHEKAIRKAEAVAGATHTDE